MAEAVAVGDAPAVGEARTVQSADALLAVQEAKTSTERSARQFARQRGESMLCRLNKLSKTEFWREPCLKRTWTSLPRRSWHRASRAPTRGLRKSSTKSSFGPRSSSPS
ncbi:MAG: hypothetical protein EXQ90_08925 [Rhodospirillales bacterium]|nr:hypothetical protein [Rhodospirillales bacterium]